MNCLKIALRNIPKTLPSEFYHADGNVYFDLSDSSKYSKTKSSEELSDFNSIKGSGVLGFELQMTPRNEAILQAYGDISVLNFDHNLLIPIRATDSGITLRQNFLQVLERRDRSNTREVDLVDGSSFWKTTLEQIKLCDLDYGKFILDVPNFLENWQNYAQYNDDAGYYFNLIDYGNWKISATYDEDGFIKAKTKATVFDLRPLFHVLGILKKGFCKVGWEFKSPILETEFGRSLVAYILSKDFTTNANLLQERYFDYIVGEREQYPTDGNWHTIIFDEPNFFAFQEQGTSYDPLTGVYKGSVKGNFNFNILGSQDNGFITYIRLIKIVANPGPNENVVQTIFEQSYVTSQFISFFGTNEQSFEIELQQDDTLQVQVKAGNSGTSSNFVNVQGRFYNEPEEAFLQKGDEISISNFIDCDLKFLDFFKGILHLFGKGKLITDYVNKTVTMYHPDLVTLWNNLKPEAYYKELPIDISKNIICDSAIIKISNKTKKRYHLLSFKKSSDDYIKSLTYVTEDNPLFSRTVDFGENATYSGETEEHKNPFFEPTINKVVENLESENAPEIPVMWDNNDNEISQDIKPRILINAGWVQQNKGTSDNPNYTKWTFEDTEYDFIPFAYQSTNIRLGQQRIIPTYNLCYGTKTIDLYKFWEKVLKEMIEGLDAEYLAYINNNFYNNTDFRDYYIFDYNGGKIKAKLKKIADFRSCQNISTPLTFVSTKDNC